MGARSSGGRPGWASRIPGPLRPLIGAAVLATAVRAVDAAWVRATGRVTPTERSATDAAAGAGDAAPEVVRDRLVYALLLGGALRLARRAGLPKAAPRP